MGLFSRAPAIHPTALVASGAVLERDVSVGPYAVIEDDTYVGAGTQIGAHAVIKRFTRIGSGNKIFEYAALGGEPQDTHFRGEKSRLLIGRGNFIREGATIHRATGEGNATVIGDENYIMAYSHVGHNCRIDNRSVIGNNTLLAGYAEVQSGVFVSGGIFIKGRCRVGRLSMVGAYSKVVQDTLPFCTADGNPAATCGLNLKSLGWAGIPPGQIRSLKVAYRLLLRSGLPLPEALRRMSELREPLVEEMIRFISQTRHGFCRSRERAAAA